MYWVLNIEGRDVRGQTNSTYVQIHITSTYIKCLEGICVRLSPNSSSVDVLGELKDTIIPHAFNSILL